MASERQRRARRRRRRIDLTARTAEASTVPQPRGKPGGPGLFGIKGAMLPPYIQHVRDELMKKGRSESQATQMAIGIVRNWAEGHNRGKPVHPDVQAAAAQAIAAYDALRARAKATPNKGRHDMSHPYAGGLLQPGQLIGEAGPTRVDLSVFDSAKHPRGAKGNPTGGQFVPVGKARSQTASQAQKSKAGQAGYKAAGDASGGDRSKVLRAMSDAQLQAASREAYSFKSSDPRVVQLRIAIAGEMARRGLDVKDFGALGGGVNSDKGVAAARARAKAVGSSKTTAAEHFTARHGTPAEKARALKRLQAKAKAKAHNMANTSSGAVDLATLTAKQRNRLKPSQFAVGDDKYPIPDLAHARNALARVAQFGTPAEQATVRAAVFQKFPQLAVRARMKVAAKKRKAAA